MVIKSKEEDSDKLWRRNGNYSVFLQVLNLVLGSPVVGMVLLSLSACIMAVEMELTTHQ
jgi:hypothetical protein